MASPRRLSSGHCLRGGSTPVFALSHGTEPPVCVEPSVSGLVAGLRRAVALAEDQATRAANAAKFGMPRDWPTALAPILDHVAARR